MPVVQALHAHGFVAGFSPSTLTELERLATRRTYVGGAVIFREGAVCDELFLVDTGLVALDIFVPGRGPVRILTVGPGELLGWSALMGTGPMTATATALHETGVFAISGAQLRNLCDSNHAAGCQILRQINHALSQRLTATRLQLLDLFATPTG